MAVKKETIMRALRALKLPDGRDVVSADMVRALTIKDGGVTFIIEVRDEQVARQMEGIPQAAENLIAAIEGVRTVRAFLSAHKAHPPSAPPSSPASPPPSLKSAPKGQSSPTPLEGVKNIIAIGSGKGGVGKSTLCANLAVSLAKAGRKVGLLDADIYGPSQPTMMGKTQRPTSPDGKIINPLEAHGVKIMSIGLMLEAEKAVIWRGPMLMGALQQMLHQVLWGELDILLIDLPPGTGDVQLTLCQRTVLRGALVISTPQDIALADARKAIDMFKRLDVEILGLVENMSHYCCPECGHKAHLFGKGGVEAEAKALGVPLLAALPLAYETMAGAEKGVPVATGDSDTARAYHALGAALLEKGWV